MSKGCDVEDLKVVINGPGILKTRKGNWVQPMIKENDSNDAEGLRKQAITINAPSPGILPIDLN